MWISTSNQLQFSCMRSHNTRTMLIHAGHQILHFLHPPVNLERFGKWCVPNLQGNYPQFMTWKNGKMMCFLGFASFSDLGGGHQSDQASWWTAWRARSSSWGLHPSTTKPGEQRNIFRNPWAHGHHLPMAGKCVTVAGSRLICGFSPHLLVCKPNQTVS